MLHLIVHQTSFMYVRGTVAWLSQKVAKSNEQYGDLDGKSRNSVGNTGKYLSVVKDLAEIDCTPGTTYLIVGDPFRHFDRVKGCRYVFINFSLLYNLMPSRDLNIEAQSWITRKHHAMLQKAGGFDLVVDFLPEQTPVLAEELGRQRIPVAPLLINVLVDDLCSTTVEKKEWDVCIVGSRTHRRTTIYEKLVGKGLSLSLQQSDDLASVMLKSRIVLNVHAYDCHTCEYPRIIEAQKLGCCLLTEPCIGIENFFPHDSFVTEHYNQIPEMANSLVNSELVQRQYGAKARAALRTNYEKLSEKSWQRLLLSLESRMPMV